MKPVTLYLVSRQQGAVINTHRIHAGIHKIHTLHTINSINGGIQLDSSIICQRDKIPQQFKLIYRRSNYEADHTQFTQQTARSSHKYA